MGDSSVTGVQTCALPISWVKRAPTGAFYPCGSRSVVRLPRSDLYPVSKRGQFRAERRSNHSCSQYSDFHEPFLRSRVPLDFKKNASIALDQTCPVAWTLDIIGGKWKCVILLHVRGRVPRFTGFQRLFSSANQKMITTQLRQLERDGLIERKDYAQRPPQI